MYRGHILGNVIQEVRRRRLTGATIPDLLGYLDNVLPGHRNGSIRYLNTAFCQGMRLTNLLFSFDGHLDPDMVAHAELWIDERLPLWQGQAFPELKRIRDYFSFLEVAVEERLLIFVCGSRSSEYRLHGVYSESGEPVWSARRGERIRATINRRLGGEFVRTGPHDDWVHRNTLAIAGPLYGPLLPVIEFSHERTIRNHLTAESLARYSIYKHHWARLYPHHPVTP